MDENLSINDVRVRRIERIVFGAVRDALVMYDNDNTEGATKLLNDAALTHENFFGPQKGWDA